MTFVVYVDQRYVFTRNQTERTKFMPELREVDSLASYTKVCCLYGIVHCILRVAFTCMGKLEILKHPD